jgi:RimJ/RimL family protein N-acetyltransferase
MMEETPTDVLMKGRSLFGRPILPSRVRLREAIDDDLELLMAWRSNPLVFEHFFRQAEPLKWAEHLRWWKGRQCRKDWIIVFEEEGRERFVGSVNAAKLDKEIPEVGVFVGEVTLWGRGVGRKAVALAVGYLRKRGYKKVWALIAEGNVASFKLFEAVGFRRIGEGHKGEWIYEMAL